MEDAIHSFETALQLNPRNAKCWYDYALVLVAIRRFSDAIEALQRAAVLEQQWVEPHIALVKVFLLLGYSTSAQHALQRAIELDPPRRKAIEEELHALLTPHRAECQESVTNQA